MFGFIQSAYAHNGEVELPHFDLEAFTTSLSSKLVLVSIGIVLLLLFISMIVSKPSEMVKRLLFWSLTVVILSTTVALSYFTVSLNLKSWSGGPIHWHADFEVWACGQELNLRDPKGLSNKIGTPSRHEHNDNRLHYEGVVVERKDAYLGNFFNAFGGRLDDHHLEMPVNEGMAQYETGQMCGNGAEGVVQTFVYKVNSDNTFSQTKVSDPQNYLMTQASAVPDGDCIIVEFDTLKDRTDKLCRSYEVAVTIGKLVGERL